MRNTTNIFDLNKNKIQDHNADFLLAMGSVAAVLDSIGKIGKDGSVYGLQKDLIELTNDLPHRVAAAMADSDQWTESMQKGFLELVIPALKEHGGSAAQVKGIQEGMAIGELKDALDKHIKGCLETTTRKQAELAGQEVGNLHAGIQDNVEKDSDLKEKLKEVLERTKLFFLPAQQSSDMIPIISSQYRTGMTAQENQKLVSQVNGLNAKLLEAAREVAAGVGEQIRVIEQSIHEGGQRNEQLGRKILGLQSEVEQLEGDLERKEKDVEQIQINIAILKRSKDESPSSGKDAIHHKIVEEQHKLEVAKREADAFRKDIIDKKEHLTKDTVRFNRQDKVNERLKEIRQGLTEQQSNIQTITQSIPQDTSDITQVVNQQRLDLSVQKNIAEQVFEAAGKFHRSVVAKTIYEDPSATKMLDVGMEGTGLSNLFTLDPTITATNVGQFILSANANLPNAQDVNGLRNNVAGSIVDEFCNAIEKQLGKLTDEELRRQVEEANKRALDEAKRKFDEQLKGEMDALQKQLLQELKVEVEAYFEKLASCTSPEAVDRLAVEKQAIEDKFGKATTDTLKELFNTTVAVSDHLDGFEDLKTRARGIQQHDQASAFMGDVPERFKSRLKFAKEQAEEIVEAIRKANELEVEAQAATQSQNVTQMNELANDLPHKIDDILKLSRNYAKSSVGAQRFFKVL